MLVAKIHIRGLRIAGRDHNVLGIGGRLYPARLLDFAHPVSIVVRIAWVCIGCDRKAVIPHDVGEGRALSGVQQTVLVLVKEDSPTGQTHFIVGSADHVVGPIGIPYTIAIQVIEFRTADFAFDDGGSHELNGHRTFAIDIHRRLQRAARPGRGAKGHAAALIRHITWGGNHQSVMDFSTTILGGRSGVNECDGDMPIFGANALCGVGHIADRRDVGIDSLEVALHATAIGKSIAVCQSDSAVEGRGRTVQVRCGHEQETAGVGVGLVMVVGQVEGVALAIDQRRAVACFVIKNMRDNFALKIIGFGIGQDVVVPFGLCASGGIAIGPMLVNLVHA